MSISWLKLLKVTQWSLVKKEKDPESISGVRPEMDPVVFGEEGKRPSEHLICYTIESHSGLT